MSLGKFALVTFVNTKDVPLFDAREYKFPLHDNNKIDIHLLHLFGGKRMTYDGIPIGPDPQNASSTNVQFPSGPVRIVSETPPKVLAFQATAASDENVLELLNRSIWDRLLNAWQLPQFHKEADGKLNLLPSVLLACSVRLGS
jgi:hypothetical protein